MKPEQEQESEENGEDRGYTPRTGPRDRRQQMHFKFMGLEMNVSGPSVIILMLFTLAVGGSVLQYLMFEEMKRLATAIESIAHVSRVSNCMMGKEAVSSPRERYDECLRILGHQR